jgi:SAM-dependent methyltransferase
MTDRPESVLNDEGETIQHWDTLHAQRRFRPRYPNEHVVRFLTVNFPEEARPSLRALDIGVGGGRHTKLLCDLGFQTFGVDISSEGLRHCEDWLRSAGQAAALHQASMFKLPFANASFDLAVSFGVYYYTNAAGMRLAVGELHRVLVPRGTAFVCLRTTADYRYGKGIRLEENTFRLTITDTNEYGRIVHFLGEADVPGMFSAFSAVQFERTETTFHSRKSANSDWLITVRK